MNLSVVNSCLDHDKGTLGVLDLPEGEPIGFGEEDFHGWIGEDRLAEKEPWSEWCRLLKHRSGGRF